jgi:phosphoribosylglycinamide formyltransferase-1
VPVLPDDTEDSLAARVLAQEHHLYPLGLRLAAQERPGLRPMGANFELGDANPHVIHSEDAKSI